MHEMPGMLLIDRVFTDSNESVLRLATRIHRAELAHANSRTDFSLIIQIHHKCDAGGWLIHHVIQQLSTTE